MSLCLLFILLAKATLLNKHISSLYLDYVHRSGAGGLRKCKVEHVLITTISIETNHYRHKLKREVS